MKLGAKSFAIALFALAFAGVARADVPPAPTTQIDQRVQAMGQWTAGVQNIITEISGVTQRVPEAPVTTMRRAERRAWAANARAWAAEAEQTFASLRERVSQLPASPPAESPISPELRVALEQTRQRLPGMVDAANEISRGYPALADAFERGQDGAVRQMRVQSIDASLITITMMHDINISQALALPAENPQRYLLLCYAHSYEGFGALMRFKREVMLTGQSSASAEAEAAAAIASAAGRTRDDVTQGRHAQQVARGIIASLPTNDPEAVAAAAFMREMLATYESSFERELQGASQLEGMSTILRQPGDFGAREPAIDDLMNRFGSMDVGRIEDAQRRQNIMMRR